MSVAGKYSASEHIEKAKEREEIERRENGKSKAWSYGGKKKHQVGKMTEEERAKKLAEMSSNASDHREARTTKVEASLKEDESAAQRASSSRSNTFIDDFQKNVYGTNKTDCTLEDTIGRRRFFSERGSASTKNAFRK